MKLLTDAIKGEKKDATSARLMIEKTFTSHYISIKGKLWTSLKGSQIGSAMLREFNEEISPFCRFLTHCNKYVVEENF